MTCRQIGNFLGFKEKQIQKRASHLGVASKRRKYNLEFFDKIDTPAKAYWLGFIYADGSVTDRTVSIEIHQDDEYILQEFINLYDKTLKISRRERDITFNGYSYHTRTSTVRLYNMSVSQQLINLNIVPNKTYKKPFSKCNEYFWHFLRGFLDGDGYISIDKDGYPMIGFTNPNKDFLQYLSEEIFKRIGYKINVSKVQEWKYTLRYGGKQGYRKILDNIYNLSDYDVKLERKYEVYKSFLGLAV